MLVCCFRCDLVGIGEHHLSGTPSCSIDNGMPVCYDVLQSYGLLSLAHASTCNRPQICSFDFPSPRNRSASSLVGILLLLVQGAIVVVALLQWPELLLRNLHQNPPTLQDPPALQAPHRFLVLHLQLSHHHATTLSSASPGWPKWFLPLLAPPWIVCLTSTNASSSSSSTASANPPPHDSGIPYVGNHVQKP